MWGHGLGLLAGMTRSSEVSHGQRTLKPGHQKGPHGCYIPEHDWIDGKPLIEGLMVRQHLVGLPIHGSAGRTRLRGRAAPGVSPGSVIG